uniref:Uncharacterized protein n=1 Tax=Sipha flava TaxID=143950 RepID=A0A2S2QZT8_9HEMI
MSADNRTYVAIRTLPNNSGVFGYVAISMGDGDDTQWLNCKGHPIQTPIPSHLHVEHLKGHFQILEPKHPDVKKVWMILKNRRPLCTRNDSYGFYKTLYENVQQEMLAERNNTKCTHPFINKLLKFLEIDLKAIGVSDLKMFCRIKMLSILKKQIKSVLIEVPTQLRLIEVPKNWYLYRIFKF